MPSNPFELWLSAFNAPLSGNVTQDIDPRFFSPNLTFEFAGDQKVEGRIVSRVASYGQQLDTLIEAVQTLAKATGTDLDELDKMAKRIADEKAASKDELAESARKSLSELRKIDESLHREVLNEAAEQASAA
jgi:DNA anti-recombination protein RmuC